MRSEGDTWDIVSSVGRTALGVATFRAIEAERPDALIRDPFARWFVEATGDQQFLGMLADPDSIDQRNFFPRTMGPRTRFFDEYFEAASRAGCRQAVILAAGLDARSYRLDWSEGTTVFEIDQTKVLEFKDGVLADHSAAPKADRRTVAADLRDDWPAALVAAGFDPSVPTAWSAEGLLPYLPGAAQDALFERIDALSVPGSRIAAHGGPGGAEMQRLREAARQHVDRGPFGGTAPFDLWYDDERADPVQWLTERGWTVERTAMDDLFRSYGRAVPQLPADLVEVFGELRNRMSFWTAVKGAAPADS
ncbi:class I SAM-dependent methyltransferase [Tsukamurella soli]|uniref:S-adenosyl-L-methionine-dependent methyltransferase n=1 Tax=Tsukamurella soli TaxID=644556 RepID=A0ABP8JGL4_9ACTN